MAHPYQCLLYRYRLEDDVSQVLIAASGAYIHAFDVSNGQHLSSWPPINDAIFSDHKTESLSSMNDEAAAYEPKYDGSQPPSKRRKTSPRAAVSTESSSAEILVEDSDQKHDLHANPVIKLAATSSGRYVVAVTGEDKCMRVFEMDANGIMHQSSERIMPKKPCAIALTPDDSTILCADKFGDVYSLPLLGQPWLSKTVKRELDDDPGRSSSQTTAQKFIPSATSLTVHTKRNLDALKQQQNVSRKVLEKKSLTFTHRLILGHVSLLTDLVCASVFADSSGRKEYILTSDRDEHIRVSRGIPQAHVIEGYCLGHTQFISKLCLIPSEPTLLISGGGNDFLLLWDWLAGTIIQKVVLRDVIEEFIKVYISEKSLENRNREWTKSITPQSANGLKIAVSNIQVLEFKRGASQENQTEIVVTCEGVPSLFLFTLSKTNRIIFREAYPTGRNVIDVVVLQDRSSVIYSMDNVHLPFSTSDEEGAVASASLVDGIHFLQGPQRWEEDLNLDDSLLPALETYAKARPCLPQKNMAKGKTLKDLLYSLETLRKREVTTDAGASDAAEHEEA